MTHRENFWRMVERRDPAWLPMDLPMTEPVHRKAVEKLGTRDLAAAFDLDFRWVGARIPDQSAAWRSAYERIGFEVPPNAFVGGDGYVGRLHDPETLGEAWHLNEMMHPLENVEDLSVMQGLPWLDFDDPALYADLADDVGRVQAGGHVAVFGLECTVFEACWYRRSMDRLFEGMLTGDDVDIWLLDHTVAERCRLAAEAAKAGVDLIRLGDDVGTQRGMMMSVPFWREHLKPRLARVMQAIRGAQIAPLVVQYHSDGDISDILDDLLELGIDALNPVQPECMDRGKVAAEFPQFILTGMVGTQTTMPFGTADDVREVVRSVTELFTRGVRCVIAPTHVLEPDVPWENIVAFSEAVRSRRPSFSPS